MKKILIILQIFISLIIFAEDNIKIWEIKNNIAILKSKIGDSETKVFAWNEDNMIINIKAETLSVDNFKSLKSVKTIDTGDWISENYCISKDSSKIYSGINGIYEIEVNTKKINRFKKMEDYSLDKIIVNNNGNIIATSDSIDYSRLEIWDIKTKKKLKSVKNPYGSITDMCFSSEGKYLITSDRSGHVYMRDVNTLKIIKTFFHDSDRSNALSVAISPDGKYIASGGTIDKVIKLWDVKTGKLLKDLKGHTSVIYSLQFSPDSTKLLSASGKCDELNLTDDKIKLWDVSTGKVITEIKGDKETAYRAIFTPDGNNIITWDGGLKSIEDFGD